MDNRYARGDRYAPQYPQPHRPGNMYEFRGERDSYRPPRQEDKFSFQVKNGPRAPSFTNQPQQQLPSRPQTNIASRTRQSRRSRAAERDRQDNSQNRQGYRRRNNKPATSNRPILSLGRAKTPEQFEGMNTGNQSRFKALEDLSNSGSESMDTTSDHSSNEGLPRSKKIRSQSPRIAERIDVPKWSNPDPYALQPPPNIQGKRPDFVSLIRKARNEVNDAKLNLAHNDDFISLNDSTEDMIEISSDDGSDGGVPLNAPSGPRFQLPSQSANGRNKQSVAKGRSEVNNSSQRDTKNVGNSLPGLLIDPHGPPPTPPSDLFTYVSSDDRHDLKYNSVNSSLPPLPPGFPQRPRSPEPHTYEVSEEKVDTWPPLRELSSNQPQSQVGNGSGKKRQRQQIEDTNQYNARSSRSLREACPICPEWRSTNIQTATPWFRGFSSVSIQHGVNAQLHNEIMDFYNYVRPTPSEEFVRKGIINRLQSALSHENLYRDARVEYFGSFASGLYLPNADMDLVIISKPFREHGQVSIQTSRGNLNRLRSILSRSGLGRDIVVIPKAKVPIVKYVDVLTGIRVDVSFENPTGLTANETCKRWKLAYPNMQIMVSLIKQYLAMRSMNDNSTGGLGGFSIICLVVNHLHQMTTSPGWSQNGSYSQTKNLGEILLDFFDLYGNVFDLDNRGIFMNPPRYFTRPAPGKANFCRKTGRKSLCIVDPNRDDNDISGGSRNAPDIFQSFSEAHRNLHGTLERLTRDRMSRVDQSILGCILGGNYRSFDEQRQRMNNVHRNITNSTRPTNNYTLPPLPPPLNSKPKQPPKKR